MFAGARPPARMDTVRIDEGEYCGKPIMSKYYTFPVNLTHILLRGCNSMAIYGMKGMLPVPISSFPFPHHSLIRAPALTT
jgi:hypothetical protein